MKSSLREYYGFPQEGITITFLSIIIYQKKIERCECGIYFARVSVRRGARAIILKKY